MSYHEAVFTMAYDETMESEGRDKMSNYKYDPGKQTWSGISRRHHPGWPGWSLIDAGKHETVDGLRQLGNLRRQFYRDVFWNPISGNELADISADVAKKVFDVAVNVGVDRGSEILQRALNLCNRNELLYPDLLVDGDIGPITVNTVRICLLVRRVSTLLAWIVCLQGAHYVQWMESNKKREEFIGLAERALKV